MPVSVVGLAASRLLRERREVIANRVTTLLFEAHPEIETQWAAARRNCLEDNCYYLDYIGEALCFGRPELFTEYVDWAAALLTRLKITPEALAFNLGVIRKTLTEELEGEAAALSARYLDEASIQIGRPIPEDPSFLGGSGPLDVLARDYLAALLRGDRPAAGAMIMAEAEAGSSIQQIYLQIFQRVLREVGRLWHAHEIGVAEEHYCTACTQTIMAQFYPRIFSYKRKGRRLVSTSVRGDLHEIGARMVSDFFEMDGWDTYYLGANTPASETLHQLAELTPLVLAISATMSFHVHAVAELIAEVRAAGRAPLILVGGPPFNAVPGLWTDVGADGYARDAAEAVAVADRWFA